MSDRRWNIADVWETIADAIPGSPALVCAERRVTWHQLDRHADALGSALLAAGLSHQAKVAQYLYNCPEYLEAIFACFKAGLVPVNTNYRYTEPELTYLWQNADAEAVVFHGEFAERIEGVRSALPGIRLWAWVDDGTGPCPSWALPYRQLAEEPSPRCGPAGARSGDDLFLLYTGGTTGSPKGAMWRQHDLFAYLNTGPAARYPYDATLATIRDAVTTSIGPVHLSACPLMHGSGVLTAIRALGQGGTLVVLPDRSFDPHTVLDAIDREHVQSVAIVGDVLGRPIVDALDSHPGRWDISSLELVHSSGLMWSEANKQAWLLHNPSLTLVDSLASSEALGIGRSTTTSGVTTETAEFQLTANAVLVDDDGRPLPPTPGLVGRIAVHRSIPIGYYKDEAKSASTFIDIDGERYAVPGDFARYDARGDVYLLGRGSQCINTGGEKVFPEEVEETLKTHPGVMDAAVVGVPDERFGEVVVALVSLKPGADPPDGAELIAHARTQLAAYKSPRRIRVVDQIPRMPNGKLDYSAIGDRLRSDAVPDGGTSAPPDRKQIDATMQK